MICNKIIIAIKEKNQNQLQWPRLLLLFIIHYYIMQYSIFVCNMIKYTILHYLLNSTYVCYYIIRLLYCMHSIK